MPPLSSINKLTYTQTDMPTSAINHGNALKECRAMLNELDKLELKYFFSDLFQYDDTIDALQFKGVFAHTMDAISELRKHEAALSAIVEINNTKIK